MNIVTDDSESGKSVKIVNKNKANKSLDSTKVKPKKVKKDVP